MAEAIPPPWLHELASEAKHSMPPVQSATSSDLACAVSFRLFLLVWCQQQLQSPVASGLNPMIEM